MGSLIVGAGCVYTGYAEPDFAGAETVMSGPGLFPDVYEEGGGSTSACANCFYSATCYCDQVIDAVLLSDSIYFAMRWSFSW